MFVVLGTAPVFTVGKGSYIANLIEMAGGRNAASDIKAPYARYSAEALVARQPDLLIVDPTVRLNDVLNQPPWNALRAVKEHRVYTLPDAAILERPGPRYNEGLILADRHNRPGNALAMQLRSFQSRSAVARPTAQLHQGSPGASWA